MMDTPRSRSRRAIPPAPTTGRSTRSRLAVETATPDLEETINADPDLDDGVAEDEEEGQEEGEELTPEPQASRLSIRGRGRGRGRGGGRGRGRGAGRVNRERTGTATADEGEEGGKSLRTRKSVSYKEIPVDTVEAEEEEEEDAEGEDEEEEEGAAENGDAEEETTGTPRPRLLTSEQPTASPSRREFEKIGSGRGGFSVKGAAAAAARARWAKYRNERTDDWDDDRGRKGRSAAAMAAARKDNKAAAERLVEGTTIEVKGKEYTVGDDELILDDDEKGDLKIDAEGRLLGGREYRLVTFTSETRKNPNKVYALTIDAARACGYTDSLAFLRRCPQILKLACNAEERQMLIDIGRVTGNLKNRMVTMVTMRNIFKLMGARVVKNGRWVADDYYEDKAQTECVENGFVPYASIHEDEILANALANMAPQGRPGYPGGGPSDTAIPRSLMSLAPTYTLGGPTTHFAGSGSDPWSEAGWGNKRTKLKNLGVTEEDWMYRTAVDCRAVDETLREMREERLGTLSGRDMDGWAWNLQRITDGDAGTKESIEGVKREREVTAEWLKPPILGRKRSGLSQEIIPEHTAEGEEQTNIPAETGAESDTELKEPERTEDDGIARTEGGKIIVQTKEDELAYLSKYNWGLGNWLPGVVRAVIEPHTHIPHVPQHTQPQSSRTTRLSHNPLIASLPDTSYKNHAQAIISGSAARGLASMEFVFESSPSKAYGMETAGGEGPVGEADIHEMRMRLVKEAEEWEKEAKRRKMTIEPLNVMAVDQALDAVEA